MPMKDLVRQLGRVGEGGGGEEETELMFCDLENVVL